MSTTLGARRLPKEGVGRRFTVAEFAALVEAGIIREGSRTYLWDGEIIQPMAEDPVHREVRENVRELLADALPREEWSVYPNPPVRLRESFQPEPDVVVVRGPRRRQAGRVIVPADVALIVEVANTTYRHDAGDYLAEYARAGIPLYWIAVIGSRQVEGFSGPDVGAGSYHREVHTGGVISFEGRELAVADIFRNL